MSGGTTALLHELGAPEKNHTLYDFFPRNMIFFLSMRVWFMRCWMTKFVNGYSLVWPTGIRSFARGDRAITMSTTLHILVNLYWLGICWCNMYLKRLPILTTFTIFAS
jgi:hypothetical protein